MGFSCSGTSCSVVSGDDGVAAVSVDVVAGGTFDGSADGVVVGAIARKSVVQCAAGEDRKD